jgi:1-acyl-sn-glycerol-3-phosphate acyltransferase
MLFIRSLVFHTLFFAWTIFWAFALLWVFLLPRKAMVAVVTLYFKSLIPLERYVLGLTYEVRGREHVPAGACVIASKHQSAYETLKLHVLFNDPAIILKKELMYIPLWGWYQAKSGMIAVDRGAGAKAIASMLANAEAAVKAGRRIVIFPQGTRVAPTAQKPYKAGVAVLAEKYDLPIVPLALNAGLFWPRHAFLIKPGKVIFEFLPPLPKGQSSAQTMKLLEEQLEAASAKLALPQSHLCE